jgi:hypothetical protein
MDSRSAEAAGESQVPECASNKFCSSLPDDLRCRLCKHCIKTSFAPGTELEIDVNHPWIVLEGLLYSVLGGKPFGLCVPGDFMLTPRFQPAQPDLILDEKDVSGIETGAHYICLTKLLVATFSYRSIAELMEDSRFCREVLDSVNMSSTRNTFYLRQIYAEGAYESVRFALKIAQSCHIRGLTHAQIAKLVGRNRSTVTSVISQIAIAEPELVQGI